MENKIIKENLPCIEFTEAIDKKILTDEIFQIEGIKYHTFDKGLQMICAQRFLLYQQDLQSFQTYGMSTDISKDYVAEMIEYQEKIERALYDEDIEMIRKHSNDLKITTLTYKEHQANFNPIAGILELAAISFISPSENPYVVDYEEHNKKIALWAKVISAQEGGELLNFFWKLSSRGDQEWMSLLMESILRLVKPIEEMSESEMNASQISENILTLAISRDTKRLKDILASKSLLSHVRQSRILSNLIKLRLKSSASSITLNTP